MVGGEVAMHQGWVGCGGHVLPEMVQILRRACCPPHIRARLVQLTRGRLCWLPGFGGWRDRLSLGSGRSVSGRARSSV